MSTEPTVIIRTADTSDAEDLARIYNWYVLHTTITFDEQPVSAADLAERVSEQQDHCPWLLLLVDGRVIGYASATRWKSRCAYRNSRETTIYLEHDQQGHGYGRQLYTRLINDLRKTPIHVLIAGIALPNESSIALHEKLGFTKAGQFNEVGEKFSRLIDVGYWQLTL